MWWLEVVDPVIVSHSPLEAPQGRLLRILPTRWRVCQRTRVSTLNVSLTTQVTKLGCVSMWFSDPCLALALTINHWLKTYINLPK